MLPAACCAAAFRLALTTAPGPRRAPCMRPRAAVCPPPRPARARATRLTTHRAPQAEETTASHVRHVHTHAHAYMRMCMHMHMRMYCTCDTRTGQEGRHVRNVDVRNARGRGFQRGRGALHLQHALPPHRRGCAGWPQGPRGSRKIEDTTYKISRISCLRRRRRADRGRRSRSEVSRSRLSLSQRQRPRHTPDTPQPQRAAPAAPSAIATLSL